MPLIPQQEPPYYEITDSPASQGIKYYKAMLAQTATDAPTVTILQNTIGNIIWTRPAIGEYKGTLTAAFTINKTICPPFGGIYSLMGLFNTLPNDYSYLVTARNNPPDDIDVWIFAANGDATDLSTTAAGPILINIEVHP